MATAAARRSAPVTRTTSAATRRAPDRVPVVRGSAAPRPAPPRPAPTRARPRRAPLRVVSPAEARRRRFASRGVRAGVVATIVAAVVALFVAAGLHAELAEQQSAIGTTRDAVAAEQARYNEARLRIAELEAPARIVAEAEALGLVTPETVTYLQPGGPLVVGPRAGGADQSWSEVKQHLALRP